MSVLALGLFLVWVLVAGVARSWWQRRRTGDAGLRFAGGRVGSGQWWANWIGILGAVTVGMAAPVADLAGLRALDLLNDPAVHWTGVAVAVVGLVATVAAQLAMGASWRIGVDPAERTSLVTEGPFAVVRNPIFTAVLVTFLGLTLAVPNLVSIVGLVVLVVGVELQVRRVEEPHLLHIHGAAYADYAARTGRFLPGLGRLPQPVSTPTNESSHR
jgi:protein-S-isoprenylcysteine O-methyltransferase Ste14